MGREYACCGVVWCDEVWCGVTWCGVLCYAMLCCAASILECSSKQKSFAHISLLHDSYLPLCFVCNNVLVIVMYANKCISYFYDKNPSLGTRLL